MSCSAIVAPVQFSTFGSRPIVIYRPASVLSKLVAMHNSYISMTYAGGYCILPNSKFSFCEDRFSVLDSDDAEVPTWSLVEALLSKPVQSTFDLIETLETIAICISGAEVSDYDFLKQFLSVRHTFFSAVWPEIVKIALDLPALFPEGTVRFLSAQHVQHDFNRRQIACLVIHQFLCTLRSPPWQEGFQSFHIWYSIEQPHPKAATAYLTSLFAYFERLVQGDILDDSLTNQHTTTKPYKWTIRYKLHTLENAPTADENRYLQPLTIQRLPEPSTDSSLLGLPRGASVISANKFIGFGRTGTQEEAHVASSPEACPAVLFTPPLEDGQVLAVTGAEAIVSLAGYGRDARCSEVLKPLLTPSSRQAAWSGRTMLFMDALELDLSPSSSSSSEDGLLLLPDLAPGNVARELDKAYLAFSSSPTPSEPYTEIFTGFWGCGTFGGNPYVKTTIQWIAASLAGVPLRFICAGSDQLEFASALEGFVKSTQALGVKTSDLKRSLLSLDMGIGRSEEIFEAIKAAL